jgi:uncharacterized protein (DUF433 family)
MASNRRPAAPPGTATPLDRVLVTRAAKCAIGRSPPVRSRAPTLAPHRHDAVSTDRRTASQGPTGQRHCRRRHAPQPATLIAAVYPVLPPELQKDLYLRRIDFAADGYAQLIRLPQYRVSEVTVDPDHEFGRPRFAHGGASVDNVIDLFRAGEPVDVVAEEFGLSRAEVEDAIRVATRAAA